MEETQKQPPLLPRLRRRLLPRRILYQNSNVTNATAEFLWERVERFLDYFDEMITLHHSPPEINKGTLTPSSRRHLCRHHRHLLLCRRLRLPPRLALVEGGHRQLPTDQEGLSRGILDVFCPCPMLRLVPLANGGIPTPQREELLERERERGVDPLGRLCSHILVQSLPGNRSLAGWG